MSLWAPAVILSEANGLAVTWLESRERSVELNESLANLEAKLAKAVDVFKRTQAEKRDLEQALEKLQADSAGHEKRVETLEREIQALRREREDVRVRLEKLLAQIHLLTKSDSTA